MNREIKNAKITDTMLGIEDHGIFTAFVFVEFQGGSQGFGGYTLDTPLKSDGKFVKRIGSAFGLDFIMQVLEVVGVEKWEDLKGQVCRVDADFTRIYRIGNFLKDKWFDPEVLATQHFEAK